MPATNDTGASSVGGHTPGPWELDGSVLGGWTGSGTDRHKRPICEIFRETRASSETLANARLLEFAPALLAALRGALAFIESEMHWSQPSLDSGEEPADQFTYDAIPVVMEIESAIAKAAPASGSGPIDGIVTGSGEQADPLLAALKEIMDTGCDFGQEPRKLTPADLVGKIEEMRQIAKRALAASQPGGGR